MTEQVISVPGVLVGFCHYEYVIHAMTDHMRYVNLIVGFDHHRGIITFFTHYSKSGVSNLTKSILLCFNTIF